MKKFGLATLVSPLSPAEFRKKYWPGNLFFSHGTIDRFSQIAGIPQLASTEALIEGWRGHVNAWAPLGSGLPNFKAEPHQLMQFYQTGYTLYFRHVGQVIPKLDLHARALERDLGLQEGDIFCDAFASQGPGAAPHFDPDMSFNIQLIGSKQWKFAKNEHVAFPLDGATMHQKPSNELTAYSRLPFPKRMPRNSRMIEAKTGTMFYIPHGLWHTTENHEPSLLLSFTVLLKSNARLLADEIHDRLRLSEQWRERNGDLTNPKIETKKKRAHLSTLLQNFRKMCDSLDADELLMKWAGQLSMSYAKTPGAKWKVQHSKASGKYELKTHLKGKRLASALSPQTIPILDWVLSQKNTFSGQFAVDALSPTSAKLVIGTLNKLTRQGLLRRSKFLP